jgi:hypothetical protein
MACSIQDFKFMASAFVSWQGLFTGRDPLKATGKLAALWFDDLIIETPTPDRMPNVLDIAIERGTISRETADELIKHWKPIQKYLPDFDYDPAFLDEWDSQLWDTVVDTVFEATEAQYPNHPKDGAFMHEVRMAAYGMMRSFTSWYSLNALDSTSYITNEREATVAERFFIRCQNRNFEIFRHFADLRVPDLERLPWNKVWELRCHPKLEAFRKRLSEVAGQNTTITAPEAAREFQSEFMDSLEVFTKLCEPSPLRALGKGFLSNIPLPIPVNPASLVFTGKEVWDARNQNREYGWLFFAIDFKNAAG